VTYVVIFWLVAGLAVYLYLRRNSPEKLKALGATMATDEIDFAEAHLPSLSSEGSAAERAAPETP
jgi:hypothetical protein